MSEWPANWRLLLHASPVHDPGFIKDLDIFATFQALAGRVSAIFTDKEEGKKKKLRLT